MQKNSSANIKLLKIQLHKIGQSGEFLGRILVPLPKTRLPLMKNLLKPLAKSVLIPLGLTASASATDATIHKNVWIWRASFWLSQVNNINNFKWGNEWYHENN